MSADDVVAIVDQLEEAGVSVWLDGGWGVDALAGEQTREHDDLDLVVLLDEVPAVERRLAELGDERSGGGPPMSIESVDTDGRQVDIHPIAPDGAYVGRDGSIWHYRPDGLRGEGSVARRRVRCLTVGLQLESHAGYDLDADDLHDISLLESLRQ